MPRCKSVPVSATRGTPDEQLRMELAIQKELGRPFEEAWEAAYDKIRWPDDKQRRREWVAALTETRPVWQDCYMDTGTEIEMDALVAVMSQ